MTRAATGRSTLVGQLRAAFDNGEFTLHYQPVVRLSDAAMVGAEALLRWNHPSEGLAPSAEFVPVLEESGLIVDIGCWVVREVVRQLDSWRLLYGRDIVDWVGVNVSAHQLDDPAALLTTMHTVDAGGFSVHRLKLEVTEAGLQRSPEPASRAITNLHAMGVRFAIDDFGIGSASLDELRRYPIDAVKIDSERIAQIGTEAGDKLVLNLLDIARAHRLDVIAESVETPAQREFLHNAGCGFGQGYLFAEPMDGARLGAYALTHAIHDDHSGRRQPPTALNRPTSADRSRAT